MPTDATAGPSLAATEAQTRAAYTRAMADAAAQQADAHRFIVEHGAAAVAGHAPVDAAQRTEFG